MADILDKFNKSKAGWTFGGSAEDLTYRKKGDYIRGGEGGDTFFESSFDFLGDLSDKFGGTLSFRLRQDGSDPFFGGGGEVRITGANLQTLKLTFEQEPGTGWNTYKIRLDQFGGWRDNKNSIASEQIIRETLNRLTTIRRSHIVFGLKPAAQKRKIGLVIQGLPDRKADIFQGIEGTGIAMHEN